MKKSITIVGPPVKYAFIIKDVKIDEVTLEKYDVECRSPIDSAWEAVKTDSVWEVVTNENLHFGKTDKNAKGNTKENIKSNQTMFSKTDDRVIEVILKDKISTVVMPAKANVIEMAVKNGGMIIKDIVTEKSKKGRKVSISDLEFFNEVNNR